MFGLANRLGVGVPRSLAAQVKAIFAKPGIEPHLYVFGPGVPILGPELVVNGDFSNGADGWALGSGWAVTGGKAVSSSASLDLAQPVAIVVPGKEYEVTVDVSATSGVWRIWCGAAGQTLSSGGAHKQRFRAIDGYFAFQGLSSFIGQIDNITVREILGYSNTYSGFVAGNYFDSAGTNLASVDGSVGMVLDAAGSVGAELAPALATENWNTTNAVISGGVVTASGVGAYQTFLSANCGIQPNKSYRVTYTISDYVSGQCYVNLGGYNDASPMRSGNGTFTEVQAVTNPASNSSVAFRHTLVGKVSIVSVREVTGIHATQGTPGYKPTLRKGIVNLLTWSNDLTNATWFGNQVSVENLGTVSKLTATGSDPHIFHAVDVVGGVTYTAAVVRSASGSAIGKTDHFWVYFAGSATGEHAHGADIPLNAEMELILVSFTPTGSGSLYLRLDVPEYLAVAGDVVTVGGVGLFQGTLTAADILAAGGIPLTTTAPASSQAGVNYLEFGGDDYLASAPLAQVGDDYYECLAVAVDTDFSGYPFVSCVGAGWSPATRLGDIYVNPEGTIGGRAIDNTGNATYIVSSASIQKGVPAVIECEKVSGMVRLIVNGAAGEWGGTHVSNMTLTESRLGLGSAIRVFDRAFVKGQVSDADKANFRKQAAAAAGIQL